MAWQFSVYLLPTFLAGGVAILLAAYAWRRRDQRAAVPFIAFMVGLAIWSIAYGIELGFTSLPAMLRWDQVAFVGSVLVPTAWLLLAADYAGYDEWITERNVGLLAVEPALTLALVWTNDLHGLIWRETALDATGPITTPALAFGPAYWANLAYSYLLIVIGFALVGSVIVRGSRIHRRQGLFLFVGTLTPVLANVAFNVFPESNPVGTLDLTPFAMAISGVFYALALFRFRMLDLVPTARETLVEAMDDGIVVADADGTIVDLNPAARAALGEDAVGRPIDGTAIGDPSTRLRPLVELPVDGEPRTYEVSATTLTDFRGDDVGQFLHLRDVTQLQVLRDHEQRLSVLNRVLRHNLRNELNVVAGESEVLAESVEGSVRDRVLKIQEAADRVLDIGEKARHVETTIGPAPAERAPVDVVAVVEEVAERLDDAYPEATVHVDAPATARGAAVGRTQLAVAVENLGENAIEHNPAASPTVGFEVERTSRSIRVSVTDDGPGIPEMERAAIERDRETPMVHASGVGLWLVRWIVEASGGELDFEAGEPAGSVVTFTLPREPARGEDGSAGDTAADAVVPPCRPADGQSRSR